MTLIEIYGLCVFCLLVGIYIGRGERKQKIKII